jgi:transcriptional regulator with XRE-family HTH domain
LKRLKEMRDARGWTQQQLAGASGVSQTFISELESCKKQPTVSIALKLARALDVELIDLLQPTPLSESEPQKPLCDARASDR